MSCRKKKKNMLSSITARKLRFERRNAHRDACPVVDMRPRVLNALTGRNVLEYGTIHRRRMISGDMEMPGGVEVIDGKLIRELGGGATTVCLPVSFQLRSHNTDEVLNDGKTFTRNVTLLLPKGVYLSSDQGRRVLTLLMQKQEADLSDEYRGLLVEAVSLNYANGVEFQYGADMPSVDLASIRMRGGGRFRYAGDDDKTDQCVIDCLVRRLAAVSDNDRALGTLQHCGRSYFINWFETNLKCNEGSSWTVDDGLSFLDLAEWIRATGVKISLYGVDASGRSIFSRPCTGRAMNLTLLQNGDHATLLTDPSLTYSVARSVDGLCNDSSFNWNRDMTQWPIRLLTAQDDDTVSIEAEIDFMLREDHQDYVGVILCAKSDHVDALLASLMDRSETYIDKVKLSTNGMVTAFVVPSNMLFVAVTTNLDIIQATLDDFKACDKIKLPLMQLQFSNQSLQQLAGQYYSSMCGDLPMSELNPHARAIFDATKLGAVNTKWSDGKRLLKVDVHKSYPSVLVRNVHPFAVFSINDDFQPFNPRLDMPKLTESENIDELLEIICDDPRLLAAYLPDGFFIIKRPIEFPWMPVPLLRVNYPTEMVAYALSHGVIELSDITHWIKPTRVLPADHFKEATQVLFENVNSDAAKLIGVFYAGMLGKSTTKTYTGFMTDHFETASKLHGRNLEDDSMTALSVRQLGDVFHVRYQRSEPCFQTSLPIYQHIVCGGVINLLEMARVISRVPAVICGVQTDCVYIREASVEIMDRIKALTSRRMGGFDFEREKATDIWKRENISESKSNHEAAYQARLKIVEENTDLKWQLVEYKEPANGEVMPIEESTWITGLPGSGKSYGIAHQAWINDPGTLVLTNTGATRDALIRQHGILRAQTFEHIFHANNKNVGNTVHAISRSTIVVVDENCQAYPRHVSWLVQAKLKNPDLIFVPVGEPNNQTRCVITAVNDSDDANQRSKKQTNEFDAEKSTALMWLVNRRRLDLPYRDGDGKRFDDALRDVLLALDESGVLHWKGMHVDFDKPDSVRFDFTIKRWICKTNAHKKRVDKAYMNHHHASHPDSPRVEFKIAVAKKNTNMKKHQDVTLSSDVRVICHSNFKAKMAKAEETKQEPAILSKVTNGTSLRVHAVDVAERTVHLRCNAGDLIVNEKQFMEHFELNYAITAFRSQSQTIDGKVGIAEVDKMSFEELWVALSRCTELSNITLSHVPKDGKLYHHTPFVHKTFEAKVEPIHAILYGIYIEVCKNDYIGKSVITNNRTVQEQSEKRFDEHVVGKLCVDKKIQEVGRGNCQLTVIHEGLYGSNYSLNRDEIALIQAFDADELLNEKDVIARANKDRVDTLERECKVPHTARLVVDAQLPTLTTVGNGHDIRVSLHYFANGKKTTVANIARNRSNNGKWTVKQVKKLVDKYWKEVNEHYSQISLIDPFTETNGAVQNLNVFLKDVLRFDPAVMRTDRSDPGSSGRNDRANMQVNIRVANQMKKRKASIRSGLDKKRRRRVEPLPIEMEIEEQPITTVVQIAMEVEEQPIAVSSNVPSGFLAWQAAKKRRN
jgi:hypothetical protein